MNAIALDLKKFKPAHILQALLLLLSFALRLCVVVVLAYGEGY